MIKPALFKEIIDGAGYEARSYSGRGMMGRQCIGFSVPTSDMLYAPAKLVYYAFENYEEGLDYVDDLVDQLFKNAKWDNMGRDDMIIYFPNVLYEE